MAVPTRHGGGAWPNTDLRFLFDKKTFVTCPHSAAAQERQPQTHAKGKPLGQWQPPCS